MAARRRSDPIKAAARHERAQRRVGEDAACTCGERRPAALIVGREPIVCFECDARERGASTLEEHHCAGRTNDPTTTNVPVNDHRAVLTEDQYNWPRRTQENPDGSPLLAISGCIRGFIATANYLMERLLGRIPEQLEALDTYLCEQLGPRWWLKAPLRQPPPR